MRERLPETRSFQISRVDQSPCRNKVFRAFVGAYPCLPLGAAVQIVGQSAPALCSFVVRDWGETHEFSSDFLFGEISYTLASQLLVTLARCEPFIASPSIRTRGGVPKESLAAIYQRMFSLWVGSRTVE